MSVDPNGMEPEERPRRPSSPSRRPVRAADADRERAVQQLQQHLADGRLDYEEFNERVDEAYAARTMDDLAHALRELPRIPVQPRPSPSPVAAPRPRPPAARGKPSGAALAANIAAYTVVNTMLVVIWLVSAISGDVDFFWPIFPLFFWGIGIIAQAVELRRHS
jgi:hypothetical protein